MSLTGMLTNTFQSDIGTVLKKARTAIRSSVRLSYTPSCVRASSSRL